MKIDFCFLRMKKIEKKTYAEIPENAAKERQQKIWDGMSMKELLGGNICLLSNRTTSCT